jgi:UDP-N-acetyl-2-amino-2-deoxyglucuronate dehydrogenase
MTTPTLHVGLIGTGAIARKHAAAYKSLGYQITVCTNTTESKGLAFAHETGAEYVATYQEVCAHPRVDYVDVCTFPDFRLPVVQACAESGRHVLVQKPIATDLETARRMIDLARTAGIQLGVVSQHRFDDATRFVKGAMIDGRLGRIVQADAYVKWYRSAEYYARPGKGSWAREGGGALINQGIHQIDLLLFLAGQVTEVCARWQIGAVHRIESEDVVNALLHYSSGATGVIQASTAFWPGYSERIEIHGTKGTAIMTGDTLTTWDVRDDSGGPAPVVPRGASSGASDPMAISLAPFERQFADFGDACRSGRVPLVSGVDGYRALELVLAIYRSSREGRPVSIGA